MTSLEDYDIIWQTGAGDWTEFELEFLGEVLFSQVPHRKIFDENRKQHVADKSLVVFSHNALKVPADFEAYFAQFKNLSLMHLSGERLPPIGKLYDNAKVVLRSCYDPRENDPKIYTMPLGFKSGFLNKGDVKPASQREFTWFFAGQVKNHRAEMLAAMENVQPSNVHLTTGWNAANSLTVADLRVHMNNSVFVPCPFGNKNPDTFRIMESLECGAIPVSLRFMGVDYFRFIFGDHPFIVADTWAEAAQIMRDLWSDKQALDLRQAEMMTWYRQYKSDLAHDVANLLREKNEPLRSKQFEYQRWGQSNPDIVRVFDLKFGKHLMARLYRKMPFFFGPSIKAAKLADMAR